MRKEYRMTVEEYNDILKACQPVPLIMLHLGMPRSPQERANDAWKVLGDKLGFDYMTVEPMGSNDGRDFTAEPKDPNSHETQTQT